MADSTLAHPSGGSTGKSLTMGEIGTAIALLALAALSLLVAAKAHTP